MKKLYYTIGTVIFVVGLIIAFENILFLYQVYILFYAYSGSLFVPLMVSFVLGMVSGACFALGRSMRGNKKLKDLDV